MSEGEGNSDVQRFRKLDPQCQIKKVACNYHTVLPNFADQEAQSMGQAERERVQEGIMWP